MQVKVLSIKQKDLVKDVCKASDIDQSQLFKQVSENEIGTFGGTPFSTMIFDHYFNASNEIDFLSKFMQTFAASHCPVISSIEPSVLNMEDFRRINQARDIGKIFQTHARLAWNSLRLHEDSRYMTLVAPRVMGRAPYSENNPSEDICYIESIDPEDQTCFVWINSCYVLAARIAEAQVKYGWTAAIRGIDGGATHDLPLFMYYKQEGSLTLKCPTEVAITDRRENELSQLGFAPLCHEKGTNKAVFFSLQTMQLPKIYDIESASANARMSSSLPYMLVASRFAHYLKEMMRNQIGSMRTADEIQDYLQGWLSSYVLLNPTASQELKAEMPLKAASVIVKEIPGRVGAYQAIMYISPHLQFDEISVSIRLVSKLPTQK